MSKKDVGPERNGRSVCPLCHQRVPMDESALAKAYLEGDTVSDDRSELFVYSNAPRPQESYVTDEFIDGMPLPNPTKDAVFDNSGREQMLIRHIASEIKSLAFLSLRGISSEHDRAERPESLNNGEGQNNISPESKDSDISLSVHVPGSSKSDFRTLSNEALSAKPDSSLGMKESSMCDNMGHVDWSKHDGKLFSSTRFCEGVRSVKGKKDKEVRLPTPGTRNNRHEVNFPVAAGDSRATTTGQGTTTLLPRGLSTTPNERSISMTISAELRDEINDALVESTFDYGRRFLPADSLRRLVTSENIRATIACLGANDEETQSLVNFVLDDARKIFVIIVNIGMVNVSEALQSLRKRGVTDRHLPIPRELMKCGGMEAQLANNECRHDAALGAFMRSRGAEMVLDKRTILPLVRVGRDSRLGYFSEVYEVELHRDHHRGIVALEDGHNLRVALKELRMDARDKGLRGLFEHETESAKALREVRHEHLLTTIISIVRGEKRYLILPWADGLDLRAFWMANEFWPLTPHLIQETVEQLYGLAGALYTLHESGWRHGDIKPENILRFNNETTLGTLKLGDLGLAKKHNISTQLRSVGTDTRVGTMRYEPPETVTSSKLPRSRKYDIWSLGCVILEFVIWLLYGRQGLDELSRALSKDHTFEEAFYTIRQDVNGEMQGEVNPVVRFWLDELSGNPDWPRNSVIADLVRLVATHLLVVRTLPAIPTSEQQGPERSSASLTTIVAGSELEPPDVRADAGILEAQLSQIKNRCLMEPEYLFPKAAMSSPNRRAVPSYQNPSVFKT
ncbi:hypothetical protein O1611_g4328 [Lasiodiplodia mahajangana]|uniref:Uncharacterized protein n=1 Tax=Lasiodiplodia mahajangana TaxID=1108764 RepID=A0ACC2JPA1_9PEZI|nr:hypothetical protein O1611_g4328 [Lasiodiplodia mahajangana]